MAYIFLNPKLVKANSLSSVCVVVSKVLSLLNNVVVDNVLNQGRKIVSIGNTNCQQQCALNDIAVDYTGIKLIMYWVLN